MDNKKIAEIAEKISTMLNREYPDVKLEIKKIACEFGFKFEVSGIENDKIKEIENKNLRLSTKYGFTQNIVGMEFDGMSSKKLNHKITGFKVSNFKYPILSIDLNTGIGYKHGVSYVKKQLGGDQLINRKSNLDKLLK